jgi:hypothetical protein
MISMNFNLRTKILSKEIVDLLKVFLENHLYLYFKINDEEFFKEVIKILERKEKLEIDPEEKKYIESIFEKYIKFFDKTRDHLDFYMRGLEKGIIGLLDPKDMLEKTIIDYIIFNIYIYLKRIDDEDFEEVDREFFIEDDNLILNVSLDDKSFDNFVNFINFRNRLIGGLTMFIPIQLDIVSIAGKGEISAEVLLQFIHDKTNEIIKCYEELKKLREKLIQEGNK